MRIKFLVTIFISLTYIKNIHSQNNLNSLKFKNDSTPKFELAYCVSDNLITLIHSAFIDKDLFLGRPYSTHKAEALFKYHFKPKSAIRILPYLESYKNNVFNNAGNMVNNDNTVKLGFSGYKVGIRLGYEYEKEITPKLSLLSAIDVDLNAYTHNVNISTTTNYSTYTTIEKHRNTLVNFGITPSIGLKYKFNSNLSLQLYFESKLSATVFSSEKVNAQGGRKEVSPNLFLTVPDRNYTKNEFMFKPNFQALIPYPKIYLSYQFKGKAKKKHINLLE